MTGKLFIALYVGLIVGMFILFFTNFWVAWVYFAYLFVAIFGGMLLMNRPYIIAAGFLLASLIVLGVGVYPMQQTMQINSWPAVTGVITRSWFCTQTVNGNVAYNGPCIEYRYSVNDQTFNASTIDTGEFEQHWWFSIPDIYKEDRAVKVYYNPGNPGISRLSTDISAADWITTGIGAIMSALSAFTLFWVLFGPKETPQTAKNILLPGRETNHSLHEAKPRHGSKAPRIPDIGDQLEKLSRLHDREELSDKEYELAKKRLLGEE